MKLPEEKLETAGNAPKREVIKNKTWINLAMERQQDKLETAGSAPKMGGNKKQNLSRLYIGTATRQARNSKGLAQTFW